MTKFRISWKDPDTEETHKEICEFEDWEGCATLDGVEIGPRLKISALDWAKDYACAMACGGRYEIEEMKK